MSDYLLMPGGDRLLLPGGDGILLTDAPVTSPSTRWVVTLTVSEN